MSVSEGPGQSREGQSLLKATDTSTLVHNWKLAKTSGPGARPSRSTRGTEEGAQVMWSLSLLWWLTGRGCRPLSPCSHPHSAHPARAKGKGPAAGQAAHSGVLLLLLKDQTLDKLNLDFFFWSPMLLWRSGGVGGRMYTEDTRHLRTPLPHMCFPPTHQSPPWAPRAWRKPGPDRSPEPLPSLVGTASVPAVRAPAGPGTPPTPTTWSGAASRPR